MLISLFCIICSRLRKHMTWPKQQLIRRNIHTDILIATNYREKKRGHKHDRQWCKCDSSFLRRHPYYFQFLWLSFPAVKRQQQFSRILLTLILDDSICSPFPQWQSRRLKWDWIAILFFHITFSGINFSFIRETTRRHSVLCDACKWGVLRSPCLKGIKRKQLYFGECSKLILAYHLFHNLLYSDSLPDTCSIFNKRVLRVFRHKHPAAYSSSNE